MKEGWKTVRLGDIATIKGGKRIPKGYKLSIEPTCHKYIRVADFNDKGTVDLSNIQYITDDVYQQIKKYTISKNDVYVSIAGTIGKTGIIPEELDGANLTENACKLVLSECIDKHFIYYYTCSCLFSKQIKQLTMTSAQPKLALTRLATVEISFPPLPEQQEIVTYLDTSFAKIDAIKANAEKELEEAKKLFAAALNEAMTPKEGWVEKTLPDISENLDSRRKPVTKGKRETGIYPYYGASGIVDYVSDYIFDEDILLISEDGANLIARSTPIAFSVSGKVWVNNHAHILKFKNLATQHFIEYYFASIKIDDYVTGAAQPKLNQKKLNSIPIWLPSLSDQHSIVTHLDTLSEKVRQLQSNYEKISSECDALKQAILRDTFE